MRKNIAKMLVYLVNKKEAISREIERGADLRQPEASTGIKYLATQGRVKSREIPNDKKCRSLILYSQAIPVREIIASIEKQKKIGGQQSAGAQQEAAKVRLIRRPGNTRVSTNFPISPFFEIPLGKTGLHIRGPAAFPGPGWGKLGGKSRHDLMAFGSQKTRGKCAVFWQTEQ